MACPTCGATMHTVAYVSYVVRHCPRCGTMTGCQDDAPPFVPALVERCRRLAALASGSSSVPALTEYGTDLWHVLGISESIHPPGQRWPKE